MQTEAAREDPVGLLRELVRFDTSNPPGDEAPCIGFLDGLLREAGVSPERVEKEPGRPNLVARLPGRGAAPGLLFCGHVDVVPPGLSPWTHLPFAAEVADGCIWGRGTLDMKGGVAMMVSAFLRAARDEMPPAGDLLLALCADEESGGFSGARFLVDERPDLFRGVRFAVGEFGGFPLYILGRVFYMIQVAEKTPAVLDLAVHGPAGHAARPMRGGAMWKLARIIERLEKHRLPVHITPPTQQMVETMAGALPRAAGVVVRRLLNPALTDVMLGRLGEAGRLFEPLFRNTVSATMVRGGDRPNVVPSEIHLVLNARVLPGFTIEILLDELHPILRGDAEISVVHSEKASGQPDFALVGLLGRLLRERMPGIHAVPYVLPGSTDGRHFARLGIQTYGYTPMNLPPDLSFFSTIHAADERIPIEAVRFGADVLSDLVRSYGPGDAGPASPGQENG